MDDLRLYTIDANGRVSFTPPPVPQKASGMALLLQIVLLALFTTPGRNVFNPERGGGIMDLVGSNIDPDDDTEIIADITQRLEKIKAEIISSQSILVEEPSSSKLRDLQVVRIERGTNIDELMVKFRIISEAGETFQMIV